MLYLHHQCSSAHLQSVFVISSASSKAQLKWYVSRSEELLFNSDRQSKHLFVLQKDAMRWKPD